MDVEFISNIKCSNAVVLNAQLPNACRTGLPCMFKLLKTAHLLGKI
jgi:hypothetical protein